ncbi:MAG: DUF58 domain-containing protein [Oscillospiraceae bacterium]|nr:DUF58 domain-containing protein [Oscillospiraceae bacterium]
MIAGYLCAIGIAVIFMRYLDGAIGVLMLAFLLLMPLLSLLMTLLVRKKISISLKLPDTVSKQQHISAVITLTKDTFLPLPFLRLILSADAHFEPLNPNADELPPPPVGIGSLRARQNYARWKKRRRVALSPDQLPICLSFGTERSAEYRFPLLPRFCGAGEVTLSGCRLSDFLGMFRFRIPLKCSEKITVTPEIPELKVNSELFRSVSTAVMDSDEDSNAMPLHSASAVPGYEHRDYIPGDSLKRINWKLSSKRRHLMVRKDEPVALARLSVVLDFRRDRREIPMTERLRVEEQMIETALGFLMLCAKNGYPCTLYYTDQNAEWSTLVLDEPEQLAVASVALLRGGCRSEEELETAPLLPPELDQNSGTLLMYFTTHTGAETLSAAEQYPALLYLIVPEQSADAFSVPKNGSLWLTTPERTILHAGGE